jgi:uncharacterized membrane protein YvlD (DUF360 family)
MRRIIDFYRLQIQVMREWQPSGGSRVRRLLATLIVSVLAFAGAVFLTPGVDLAPGAGPFATVTLAALVLAVLNVAIRPVFIAIFASISVVAVVAATLVFQVVSFAILPNFVDGLVVTGWIPALVASFAYALVTTTLTAALSISSDDSYYSLLVQQLAARQAGAVRGDKPGLVVIQIDGEGVRPDDGREPPG